jgi:4'-phosphopantetheinyl transferase
LDVQSRWPTVEALHDEAHVWLTITSEWSARRPEWLDRYERTQWMRFRHADVRDLFLIAHTHLRATLSRYAPLDPSHWRFERRPGGRPELRRGPGIPDLRFNLSHTPGLVACVVTHAAACGVDVEREGAVADRDGIAEIVLDGDERAAVARRPQDLLAYWTLKESYVKATGAGLRVALRDIHFELRDAPAISFDHGLDAADGWVFSHGRPTARHHLAVAVRPSRAVQVYWA